MSRRVRTLVVTGVLFVVLFVVAVVVPVPYVLLSPGPTLNTLGVDDAGAPIITITGHPVNKTDGHLNLTTVNVGQASLTSVAALIGWLKSDRVVVPRTAVFPPGQSPEQVDKQDTADFSASQDSATAAAFCELGYPRGFGVLSVPASSPAHGKLQAGDQLVSLDGTPVASAEALTAALNKATPNATATLVVSRRGVPTTVPVVLTKPPAGQSGARIGITVGTGCLAPFEVHLGLGGQIGGPSAGMMFALGIIDKVGAQDLTRGRFVAGSGTIDPAGTVGPIGGIQLKMIAARRAGATVFLAPEGNCTDVQGATPAGLDVVKVDSLRHAVEYLQDLEQSKPVPHC